MTLEFAFRPPFGTVAEFVVADLVVVAEKLVDLGVVDDGLFCSFSFTV